ncbi:MAG TPA: helix-turn-helix domain-containing protein [Alphaproteobacteria bacterium]|nr:helix-turn-helix domain-containing protein [Alphaproteobacteria bacterium]
MASQPTQLSEAANRRAHLKEVTNDPAPDSLGAELRAARLKLGTDIKDASRFTKIKPEYLEALEEGRIEALPGRTYAIGFLRAYAGFLKLDPAALVARFKAEHPVDTSPEAQPKIGLEEAPPDMRIPQGALIVVGIIIIALIYAGVYLFRSANEYMEQRAHPTSPAPIQPLGQTPDTAPSAAVPEPTAPIGSPLGTPPKTDGASVAETSVPAQPSAPAAAQAHTASTTPAPAVTATTAPVPKPAAPAQAPKVQPTGQTNAHAAPASTALNDHDNEDAAEPPAPSAAAAPSAPSPDVSAPSAANTESYEREMAAAPKSFGASAKDSRVTLRATDTVFLRIETEGPRNQVLFDATLNKGEVYHVPQESGVILTTRNGGAVEVYVDGVSKGAAGPAGIALSVSLDPDALKSR